MRNVEQCSDEMKMVETNLDDMRRDERSLDEIRRVQMRWDDVWSVESEVWSVKRAVSSATFGTQSVAWCCIATWICAGHDRWRRQRGSFAKKNAHARAWPAQRASSMDEKNPNYSTTPRQLPPTVRLLSYCWMTLKIIKNHYTSESVGWTISSLKPVVSYSRWPPCPSSGRPEGEERRRRAAVICGVTSAVITLWRRIHENPIESTAKNGVTSYIMLHAAVFFVGSSISVQNLKHWASAQVISGKDNEVVLNHFFSEDWGIKDFQYSHVFLQPDMPMFKSAHAAEWTGSRTCCVLSRT